MSGGWEAGDKARCIKEPDGDVDVVWEPVVGSIYTVAGVDSALDGGVLLDLAEDPDCLNDAGAWDAECFRKIEDDKREPCEAEFVELLNRAKRPVAA